MRSKLRGLRDDNGQPLFVQDMKAATPYSLDGQVWSFDHLRLGWFVAIG